MATYNYSAALVPVPMVPTAPPSVSGCTDSTTTAANLYPFGTGIGIDALQVNQNWASIAAVFAYGGGYGVCNGLVLSTGSGLALAVSTGTANCMGAVPYPGGTVVVPDSTSIGFVWLLQNGTLTPTVTTTPPSSNCVYIGNFTTSGGNVTAVDYSGVCYCTGGGLIRTVGDRSAPVDTPNVGTIFLTNTLSGIYHFNGAGYTLLPGISTPPVFAAALTGGLQLIPQDNRLTLLLSASGGNQNVLLPDPSSLPTGWAVNIFNVGSANSLILQDHTGTNITGGTISTTNRSLQVTTYTNSSNAVVFPSGTYAPGPVPQPGPSSGAPL